MKTFKKILSSKVSIAIIFFLIGYFTNLALVKFNHSYSTRMGFSGNEDRIPVTPEEFDSHQLVGKGFVDQMQQEVDVDDFNLNPIRKEDDHAVYYEIPINKQGKNNKLKVEVKDGQIHILTNSEGEGLSAQSEQVFSIDEGLNENKADVKTESDKIIITIPKKK